ncbi:MULTISPECIES: IS30 family transposase, partial [unclassified Granulicatella]|uniref:IS30 family transposase n=1 Tax=unclassified Granulicatella TaxID=2630493 RepID=UPI0010745ECC
WEIDLMIGKITKNESVILTLIERKTRFIIIRKLKEKSSECVNKALKKIFKQYGKKWFKSITADNGSEFSRLTELESYLTAVYFAH